MHKLLMKRWHGLHLIWAFILLSALIGILYAYNWILATIALVLCGALIFYTMEAEKAFRKDLNRYVATLSHRIKKAGNTVIQQIPLGILLYDEEKNIVWHNPYVAKMLERDSAIGEPLLEVLPGLEGKREKANQLDFKLGKTVYRTLFNEEERLLFIYDVTEQTELQKKYMEEKIAVGILLLDNLEEATQGMDDQVRSVLLAKVTGAINDWAVQNQVYLRRSASDRFLLIMDQRALQKLEQTRFEILDDVRDMTADQKVPFTISIGIATGGGSIGEVGQLAQSSLDMALGRGGDQVVVRVGQKMSFYGGRTNAVEKRTRVRARVISHALRDLIRESDKVIIMGHKTPDLDSVGAAIGVLKAVQVSNKEGYVVLEDVNPSIEKLMDIVYGNEKIGRWFITPEQALAVTNMRTLIVVVDTHRASLVAEPKLLQQTHRIVVVDHHRRGEEFINGAVLLYMEPYASSTCELVTELLEYFHDKLTMDVLESTALLAGIAMDTKNFSLRTGARTFDAASFLRRHGADLAIIQKLQKEDFETYINKSEIIKHAEILYEHVALAVTEPNRKYPQMLIAQAADTLLNMTDIAASFVISQREDGLIGISARSLGQINVQVIMERLGGGGHLTNAATQLDCSLEEAEERLKQVLAEIEAEEGLWE